VSRTYDLQICDSFGSICQKDHRVLDQRRVAWEVFKYIDFALFLIVMLDNYTNCVMYECNHKQCRRNLDFSHLW
jgi:hypothetical protein